jgi:hypothetical protein
LIALKAGLPHFNANSFVRRGESVIANEQEAESQRAGKNRTENQQSLKVRIYQFAMRIEENGEVLPQGRSGAGDRSEDLFNHLADEVKRKRFFEACSRLENLQMDERYSGNTSNTSVPTSMTVVFNKRMWSKAREVKGRSAIEFAMPEDEASSTSLKMKSRLRQQFH